MIELHPIIKPWSFRGSAINAIRAINPPSSMQQEYILIATDYFIKWIKLQAFQKLNAKLVNLFLEVKNFTRFGVPETITVDKPSMFTGIEFDRYRKELRIQKTNSTPYFAQANV